MAALLGSPPAGIRYTDYDQALNDGRLRVRGRRAVHGRQTTLDRVLLAVRFIERLLRSAVMFREPTWFVSCAPGEFDLIHAHLFGVRQVGPVQLPVVSSAGLPLHLLYRHREQWSRKRLWLANALEAAWSRVLKVHNPWCRASDRGVMTVYSDQFRQRLIASGIPPDKVLISGTALPARVDGAGNESAGPLTAMFIGRDFELKGGPVALAAFNLLAMRHPDWRFVVVTGSQWLPLDLETHRSVTVLPVMDRDFLVNQLLPTADVLAHPTQLDCGAPYAVMEALRSGASIVISPLPWLDDRLVGPAVEQVQPIPEIVAAAIERQMDTPRDVRRAAAGSLWEKSFSMETLHEDLTRAYDKALARAEHRP